MANVSIAGPAKKLLRVRERGAALRSADGIFGSEGPARAVVVTFSYADNGERLAIVFDQAAWRETSQRVERAFIPVDLPGQIRMF